MRRTIAATVLGATSLVAACCPPPPVPGSGAIKVSVGGFHSCVLTAAGGVKCWGMNYDGQLGDGTNDYSNVPVDVAGLTSGVVDISLGLYSTCAVTTSGAVKCWGATGGPVGFNTPVDMPGLSSGVASVSAGGSHACAVTTAGGAKCWGQNSAGGLGDGTTTDRTVPVDVVGLTSGVASISAGNMYTCALTTGGGVKCWGQNYQGELGDGSTDASPVPVDVVGLTSGVAAISATGLADGEHTCALTAGGGAKCWGQGPLGDGTTDGSLVPVDVDGLTSGVIQVEVGVVHSCAVTTSGGAKCWGVNVGFGMVGDGTTIDRLVPVDVVGLGTGVRSVAAGWTHSCVVLDTGGVRCWGENHEGELGDGTNNDSLTPVDVVGIP